MKVIRWACVAATSAIVGCGGGGDGGGGTTNPPPPPPGTQTLGSISTSVSTLNLAAGNTETISVSAFDTNGGVIVNVNPSFAVASSTVAEVDGGGTVLGIRSGATTINVSVTLGAVTKTATVAVNVTGQLPSQANVTTTSGDFFTPNKIALGPGGQVTWTFGGVEHTVVFSAAGSPAGITSGGYSSSHSRTFTQTGNFSYVCTIHAGMNGQVIVR